MFCLEVRKHEINRTCAFHSLRYFKIQTQLTNWWSLSLLFHQPYLVRPHQTSTSRRGLYFRRSHPGAFQNVTIEKVSFTKFKTTVQSKFCCIWDDVIASRQTLKLGTLRSPISWRLHWYLHFFLRSLGKNIWMNVHYIPNAPRNTHNEKIDRESWQFTRYGQCVWLNYSKKFLRRVKRK